MIKKHQSIYPSSKVPRHEIEAYGWRLIEELPARKNPQGHVVPIPEASQYLRELRQRIDAQPTIPLATEEGVIHIEDFAVAHVSSPHEQAQSLGFYALINVEN